MRRFLLHWALLNLLLFALILVFPIGMAAVFQLFNGWVILPLAVGMALLARLPLRPGWRKAKAAPLGVRTKSAA